MGFGNILGGAESSTKQTANNQQLTNTGTGIVGFGANSTFNIGSTTFAKGVNIKNSSATKGGAISSPIPSAPAGTNILTITTADVNAIDLASHALDVNAVSNANALSLVANNSRDLANSAFAVAQNLGKAALDETTVYFSAATSALQSLLVSSQQTTNQALALAANTVPQSTAAASEIAAGNSPLSGTLAPATIPDGATSTEKILLIASIAVGALALFHHYK